MVQFVPLILSMAFGGYWQTHVPKPDGLDSAQPMSTVISEKPHRLRDFNAIVDSIQLVFAKNMSADIRKDALMSLFERIELPPSAISKYAKWDDSVPYTRNRISTDGKNYELLMLCWNPKRESKVHNHPGEGCFVKMLSGCIRETIYDVYGDRQDILSKRSQTDIFKGHVTYINDNMGLHQLGNPREDEGAITLHLYIPPVSKCMLWGDLDSLTGLAKKAEVGMSVYSIDGEKC